MRREYQTRRDELVDLLQSELGDLICLKGLDTGLHLLVEFVQPQSDKIISEQAAQNGIIVSALSNYYGNPAAARATGLVLGFGDVSATDIKRAGKTLCNIIINNISS